MDYSAISPKEAVEVQNELRKRVIKKKTFDEVEIVAGVDVSVKNNVSRAAVVTFTFPGLELKEEALEEQEVTFPYVPGLLAFRELPVILEAFKKLISPPDLLMVDGQGYSHPRRFGLACHLGVTLDIPAIGCAKSRLVGEHAMPGEKRGAMARLKDKDEVIGAVVRTRENVKPVYVSAGHRIDLDTAIDFTLRLATKYRLPDPIRAAHNLAKL